MTTNLRQLFLEHVGQTSDNPMMLEVERAEGVYLYGPDGRRWIDLISGVSVSAVGHGNRRVIDAICAQARDYLHLMVYGEAVESPQVRYAERIASLLPDPLDTVYFVNSGSEAVEGALKLAKRYTGRTELVYYRNAYHGSTAGSLSVIEEECRNSYRPLLPDTRCIRFNEPGDLKYITSRTACVIIEPVQGEGDHPFGKGLSGSVAPPLRRDRRAARFRRDTDRAGPDRHALFFSAVRRRARYTMYGQGVRRRHAARSLHRSEPDHVVAEDQSGARAHHDFRRSSGLLRRRLGGPRVHPIGGAHGAGRRGSSTSVVWSGIRPCVRFGGCLIGVRIRRSGPDKLANRAARGEGADDRVVSVPRYGHADRSAADDHPCRDRRVVRHPARRAVRGDGFLTVPTRPTYTTRYDGLSERVREMKFS